MPTLSRYLTYAGALPFIALAIAYALDVRLLPIVGSTKSALSAYTLIIVCFMAGSHWGLHLKLSGLWQWVLPLTSNSVAIVAWLAFLDFPFRSFLLTMSISFILLLLIDLTLSAKGYLSKGYIRVRVIVTAVVVTCLLMVRWQLA